MNSLFLRLWVTLSLVIVLVVFSSVGIFEYLRTEDDREQKKPPHIHLRELSKDLQHTIKSGESAELWLSQNSNDGHPVFLINTQGEDLGGKELSRKIKPNRLKYLFTRKKTRISIRVDLPNYPPMLLLAPRPDKPDPIRWFSPQILIGLGLLISGLAAIFLARYITQPIKQLKAASDQIAQGEFQTNVSASMADRKDEIADLARRFDQMSSALARSHAIQQHLLRDISHELRSPITRLLLTIDLLDSAQEEERKNLEKRLRKDLNGLNHLVDEVVTLTRFYAESETLNLSRTNLVDTLLPVLDDADFEANALNKTVVFDYSDKSLQANIDTVQLQRAVENLLRNAIRHTPEHTTVRATLSKQASGNIMITVQDEGDGVDEQELEKIFTPFYRSATARAHFDGTGIGLALVERIVKAHGGSVTAHNTANAGLCVSITLPTA